jgi:peptide/nickel transport system substrate-binding protein
MVIEVLGEIGQYGGRLRGLVPDPATGYSDDEWLRGNSLAEETPDGKAITANIARAWELSDDLTELTVYMRKGMKWSDGAPLTTGMSAFGTTTYSATKSSRHASTEGTRPETS